MSRAGCGTLTCRPEEITPPWCQAIRYVMKNGETLDRTWPDRRPLPRLWWWEETAK